MLVADRLAVPDDTRALLFDMDGVLLDTLSMDFELVNRLVVERFGAGRLVPRESIRRHFPRHLPEFWRGVLADAEIVFSADDVDELVTAHERERRTRAAPVHAGIPELLRDAAARSLRVAVVSNNPTAEVDDVLAVAGIRDGVEVVVGNDLRDIAPKPAPDAYLLAAELLGVSPTHCVAVEDSILGAEAAHRAGCLTVTVATGANTGAELAASPFTDHTYADFARPVAAVVPETR